MDFYDMILQISIFQFKINKFRLMKQSFTDPALNSNSNNFLHYNPHGKQVHQIQPDKFTFLKSNLLISNILNRSIQKKHTFTKQINDSNAYINCQVELNQLEIERQVKKNKIQKIRNLAKCRSQITFQQFVQHEANLNDMVNNVFILKRQMNAKAAEIMGKKESSSYLGRNNLNQKENFLKQMKQANPADKINKVQTTRLLMKQMAKKCNNQQYKQLIQESMINISMSRDLSHSGLNSSCQTSLLDLSQVKKTQQKTQLNEVLKKLAKNKSHDQFMQEQKRRAVWQGFSLNWKKGGQKTEQMKQVKKKVNRKKLNPKFQTSEHAILNYTDKHSRHLALKNYEKAFAQTASTLNLKIVK